MSGPAKHLLIMARQPRAGRVKTRLAADIGVVEATRTYRVMLWGLIRRLAGDPRWQCWVAVSGIHELASPVWPAGVHIVDQGTGNLGARMQRMFNRLPPGPVAIIGSDVPAIGTADIADAFAALGRADVVLGPSPDGGYWLVGQARRRTVLQLFDGVRWSSPHAFADTMHNAAGRRVELLRQLADVDDAASYREHVLRA